MLISSKLYASNAQVLTVAISSAPNNLNPFFSTDASSQNINRLVHRSLISINSKMEYQCDACETFTSKMVGKKQVFTFKIKPDLKFQDGSSLLVEDIKQSWDYYANDKKIKSVFNKAFSSLESVNIIDSKTVELVYKNFSLENLSNLTLLKLLKIKDEKIIGCGDYFIKNATPLEIEVQTNRQGYPNFKFKIVKDETTLSLKLINKEVDLAVATMSPRKVAWLRSRKNILQVWERPSNNFIFMAVILFVKKAKCITLLFFQDLEKI
jgi:peptide/nickel transport system substrate-binding protein